MALWHFVCHKKLRALFGGGWGGGGLKEANLRWEGGQKLKGWKLKGVEIYGRLNLKGVSKYKKEKAYSLQNKVKFIG